MSTIEKALQIAARAHEGQEEKNGLSYIIDAMNVTGTGDGKGSG